MTLVNHWHTLLQAESGPIGSTKNNSLSLSLSKETGSNEITGEEDTAQLAEKVGRQMQWLMQNRSVPPTEEWMRREGVVRGHQARLDRQLLHTGKTLLSYGWGCSDRGDWYRIGKDPEEPRWTPCERRMLETLRALGGLFGSVPEADLTELDRILTAISAAVGANDAKGTDAACDAYESFARRWMNRKLELD